MDSTQATFLGNLKEDVSNYLSASLADFYTLSSHRLMVYAVSFILIGLGVFGSLTIYDYSHALVNIKLTFKGMYAWHTAINYTLCFVVVDAFTAILIRPWGAFERRTVGKAWIILLGAFLVGLLTQRTFVYQLTRLYEPSLVWTHGLNPSQRPGAMAMFLFVLPFWLIIAAAVMRIITSKQAQTEELLRVRIDAILEERSRQSVNCPEASARTAASVTPASGVDLKLPTDPGVGPIGAADIGHISVEDHYLRIYFQRSAELKNTLIRMPLKQIATCLPGEHFVQIHRSHMVNLEKISGLKRSGRTVRLTMKHGAFELPVSRYRLPRLLPVLERYLNP